MCCAVARKECPWFCNRKTDFSALSGFIDMFAISFAVLMWIRNRQGYHERLLLLTSISSFVANTLLIYTDGPPGLRVTDLESVRAMTLFEVVGWSIREIGLLLYGNKLVRILDVSKREVWYYRSFYFAFGSLCAWRTVDLCLRTSDPLGTGTALNVVRKVDPAYLGTLSALELLTAFFLVKLTVYHIRATDKSSTVHAFARRVLSTGVLRVVFVNMIPGVRLIMNQTISSSFNYSSDASAIIYYLQSSMNLMYLIDLAMTKMDSSSIFRSSSKYSGNVSSNARHQQGFSTDLRRVTGSQIGNSEIQHTNFRDSSHTTRGINSTRGIKSTAEENVEIACLQ
ncbi:hypothetical protein DFJ77DRAFT_449148 [Powellomyces hirtus]|nr:hypothetical protein DFJ77DRAFT_449148 [Powellomyces hirtus]